jgi:hypothetical protein
LNIALGRYFVVTTEGLRYYMPFTKWLFYDRVYLVEEGIPLRLAALTEEARLACMPRLLSASVAGWLALMLVRRPHREGPPSEP